MRLSTVLENMSLMTRVCTLGDMTNGASSPRTCTGEKVNPLPLWAALARARASLKRLMMPASRSSM